MQFWFMMSLTATLTVALIVCLQKAWLVRAGLAAALASAMLCWAFDAPNFWYWLPGAIGVWIAATHFDDTSFPDRTEGEADNADGGGCIFGLIWLGGRLAAVVFLGIFLCQLIWGKH